MCREQGFWGGVCSGLSWLSFASAKRGSERTQANGRPERTSVSVLFPAFSFFLGAQPWAGEGSGCEQGRGTWGCGATELPAGLSPEHVPEIAARYRESETSSDSAQQNHSGSE